MERPLAPPECADLHCHLDRYPDPRAAVREAGTTLRFALVPALTPASWPELKALVAGHPRIEAAIGLHPRLAQAHLDTLDLFDRHLPETRFVGEVGLDDGPAHHRSLGVQKEAFRHILEACARSGDKILTVHSARASRAVLDLIEAHLPPDRGQVILHWFTGSAGQARRAAALGCRFSIHPQMLARDWHLPMIQALPLDRLLTESDAPFGPGGPLALAPALARTVEALARAREMAPSAMGALLRENLEALLPPPGSPSWHLGALPAP